MIVNTIAFEKISLLICNVLRVFVNAMSADDKYSLRNRGNLTQPVQMQLPQNQETLSQFFFFAFLKYTLNFKHFGKREDTHS